MKTSSHLAVLVLLLSLPFAVSAHTGAHDTYGLFSGFAHPFSGLDHLLAMLAVGIWTIQMRHKSMWLLPAAFVSVMLLGAVLGLSGLGLPYVETGIALSVLVFGLLIASAIRLPTAFGVCLVAVFALFHGYAHGTEMPAGVASGFMAGFALATALLHISGMASAILLRKFNADLAVRVAGGAMALSGMYMVLA
jgi:urease accessory protein